MINSINISIPIILERIGCLTAEEKERDQTEGALKVDGETMVANLAKIEKRTNEILALVEM